MRDGGANRGDALALDQYLAWSSDVAGFNIQQAGGMEDDGAGGLRGERTSGNKYREETQDHETELPAARDASSTCSTSD